VAYVNSIAITMTYTLDMPARGAPLVVSDGVVHLTRMFDPFGLALHEEGSGKSHFGFAGSQAGGLGLLYVDGRYFDPRTG
jgi:hypothetical protein